MEICLKDTLRRLRREKGITQEQLADHLGITQQSVGKWERGEGLPDITLLPAIALYFDVTVDDLLGVEKTRIDAQVQVYKEQDRQFRYKGDVAASIALWEKAYKEFPNHEQVKYGLMNALFYEFYSGVPNREDTAERIIALGEDLLAHSSDPSTRGNVIQTMCFTYKFIGNVEKAKAYANMQGLYWTSQEQLLTAVLEGEELLNQCQCNIQQLIDLLHLNASSLAASDHYTPEEKQRIERFQIDLFKLVYENGDYGFYAGRLARIAFSSAALYAQQKKVENCLAMLEEMAGYAIQYDTAPDSAHTSLLVNQKKYSRANTSKNYTGNDCSMYLNHLQEPLYDFIREEPRFSEVVRRMSEVAR